MWKKRLFYLLAALLLVVPALLYLRAQRTEPIYFRTAVYGRNGAAEEDPFRVLRWAGGDTYTPVFTEGEEVRASALQGGTLYYTLWRGEEEGSLVSQVYRVNLETGEKETLGTLEGQVLALEPCGEALFLVLYDPARCRRTRLGVLREGACQEVSCVYWPATDITCDDRGCWYMEYDEYAGYIDLHYCPADTLEQRAVRALPRPTSLQAGQNGVYYTNALARGFAFYPKDGGEGEQGLAELPASGLAYPWEDKLIFLRCSYSEGTGKESRYHAPELYILELESGKLTDCGEADMTEIVGVSAVHDLPLRLSCGRAGFIYTETHWGSPNPAEANAYWFYTWDGKRRLLRQAGIIY